MTFRNTCCAVTELIQACAGIVKEWLPSVEVKAAFLCEQCPDFITILPGLNLRCEAGHHCNLTKEMQYWLKIPCTPEVCCLCTCYRSSDVGLHVPAIVIHQQCIIEKYCALLDGFNSIPVLINTLLF